jgi:hypothetical protein
LQVIKPEARKHVRQKRVSTHAISMTPHGRHGATQVSVE